MIPAPRGTQSRRLRALVAGIATLSSCSPALAEPPLQPATLTIKTVTPPAWVIRNAARTPLAPGTAVQPGEILHTGTGGRVEASLGGPDRLHLGAETRLFVSDADTATLRLLSGAFHISSRATRPGTGWLIRLPGLSAVLADADLWGRVTESHQHLMLGRGTALVRTDAGRAVKMERPHDRLTLVPDDPNAAIAPATPAERARLRRETGAASGSGMLTTGGRWRLTVLETRSEWKALSTYDSLRDAGYPALISPSDSRSAPVYRVVLRAIGARAEAQAVAARLRSHPGFEALRPRISMER